MKREELREILGESLTKEQENEIMELHGTTVNGLKSDSIDLQNEVNDLRVDKSKLETELKDKESELKDTETLRTEKQDLENELNKLKTNQEKATRESTIEKAIYANSKARDPKSMLKFIDMDRVEIDDGEITSGLTEQIESRQETHPWEFDLGTTQDGYQPNQGQEPQQPTKESILAIEDSEERQKAIEENIELFD